MTRGKGEGILLARGRGNPHHIRQAFFQLCDAGAQCVDGAFQIVAERRASGFAGTGAGFRFQVVPALSGDAAIARAEKAARSGDLSAAVAELSKMDGAAANAASDWLAGAHSRISADAVRAELTKSGLSALAAGG